MIENLLEYQKIDSELCKIEMELAGSEERKKIATASNFLKTVNESVAKLDSHAGDLADKYASISKLYEKLKESQDDYENIVETCEDADELSYIKKKAQELSEDIKTLAMTLDNLSQDISNVLKEYKLLRVKIDKAKAQREEYIPKFNELKASKEAQMNDIKEKLAKLENKIDKKYIEMYKQKRNDKIFPIVYEVTIVGKAGHCPRCGTELSMSAMNNVKSGELIECESCRRLLYLKNSK